MSSPFAACLTGTNFGAFPPPTLTMIGAAPGPGRPGGGWLLSCETSMGWLPPWFGFPRWANSVSFATYDWFTVCTCGPRWLIIVLAIPLSSVQLHAHVLLTPSLCHRLRHACDRLLLSQTVVRVFLCSARH